MVNKLSESRERWRKKNTPSWWNLAREKSRGNVDARRCCRQQPLDREPASDCWRRRSIVREPGVKALRLPPHKYTTIHVIISRKDMDDQDRVKRMIWYTSKYIEEVDEQVMTTTGRKTTPVINPKPRTFRLNVPLRRSLEAIRIDSDLHSLCRLGVT